VAISSQRIKRLTPDAVTFLTRDGKTCTLTPYEFTRRFLLHILPRGFTKIRHFGLVASSSVNTRLPLARELILAAGGAPWQPPSKTDVVDALAAILDEFLAAVRRCPRCRVGRLSISIPLPPERPRALVGDTS